MLRFLPLLILVVLVGCKDRNAEVQANFEIVESYFEFGGYKSPSQFYCTVKNQGSERKKGELEVSVTVDRARTKPLYFKPFIKGDYSDQELLGYFHEKFGKPSADNARPAFIALEKILQEGLLERKPSEPFPVDVPEGEERYYNFSIYLQVDLKPHENKEYSKEVHLPQFAEFRVSSRTVRTFRKTD